MEKNPKKSKAFIITFVAVLLLLILAFYLFTNKDTVFGIKSINIGKMFSSLTGTQKNGSLKTINTSEKKNSTTNNNTNSENSTSTTTNNPNNGTAGGFGSGSGLNPSSGGLTGGTGVSTGAGGTGGELGSGSGFGGGGNSGFGSGLGSGSGFGGGGSSGGGLGSGLGFGGGSGGTGTGSLKCLDKNASNYGLDIPCSYPISIPDPMLCQDKAAINYKQPLPCKYTKNTSYQCNDKIDNDNDGLIDSNDPGCHTDNDATNTNSYDNQIDNESNILAINELEGDMCPYDPLENYYSEEEKAKLVLLRRKFYLLAPTLKIEDDIDLVKNDTNRNRALVEQSDSLTNDCRAQIDPSIDGGKSRKNESATPNYTGPKTQLGNPYYNTSITGTYFPSADDDFQTFEKMMYIW